MARKFRRAINEAAVWAWSFISTNRRKLAALGLLALAAIAANIWPDSPVVTPLVDLVRAVAALAGAG